MKTELDCAPYRESGTVEPRWADFRFRITSEPRFQKLMRVDFSVQATSVHRTCLSPKEVRENVQFEWYRG